MATKTNTKEKGHRFTRVKYFLPYFSAAFFEPAKEMEEEQDKMIRLPVKIDEEKGESRSNVTNFEIKAITHFDKDVEQVLVSLLELDTRIVKTKKLENPNEGIKLTCKMLQLICTGTASHTLQEATQIARQEVYDAFLAQEYEIDDVEEEIVVKDEDTFFEFIERDFSDSLDDQYATTQEYTKDMYKVFRRTMWNHLHGVMFGVDAYRAFKIQKDYMMKEIIKPYGVSVEAAFRRVETLINLLSLFPPAGSRGKATTPAQWDESEKNQKISKEEKREMKYNLLPDTYHDRFDQLEQDWQEMSNAKFLTEAQKCEEKDAKKRLEKPIPKKKKRDEDSEENLNRSQREKRVKKKQKREDHPTSAAGQARLCYLCKMAGAPEFVYTTHNTENCKKKGDYAKRLSGGVSSRFSATKDYSRGEKKIRKELKVLTKKLKKMESKGSAKRKRQEEDSVDSSSDSSDASMA